MVVKYFLLGLCVISSTQGVRLPDSIPLCRRSDHFVECAMENARLAVSVLKNGNKTLGLQRLEPFFVPKMYLGDSGTSQQFQLNQDYTNIYIHGISNTTISNLEIEFSSQKCFWRFVAQSPNIRMDADYVLKGQILVFPINGRGKCSNNLENVKVVHQMKCVRYEKNGKHFFNVTEYSVDMQPASIIYHFETVIPGNEQLSQEVEKTVNENALDVFQNVKSGFDQSYGLIYKSMINGVFSKVSEEELFLD